MEQRKWSESIGVAILNMNITLTVYWASLSLIYKMKDLKNDLDSPGPVVQLNIPKNSGTNYF